MRELTSRTPLDPARKSKPILLENTQFLAFEETQGLYYGPLVCSGAGRGHMLLRPESAVFFPLRADPDGNNREAFRLIRKHWLTGRRPTPLVIEWPSVHILLPSRNKDPAGAFLSSAKPIFKSPGRGVSRILRDGPWYGAPGRASNASNPKGGPESAQYPGSEPRVCRRGKLFFDEARGWTFRRNPGNHD